MRPQDRAGVSARLRVFAARRRLTPGPSPFRRGENDKELEASLALVSNKMSSYREAFAMLRTAIIGYGAVAKSHLRDIQFFREDNLLRSQDDPVVEPVAGCDIRPEALEEFREDTGVTALYEDFSEMLNKEQLDYVHIATCADVRVEPVLACAQRGVHILCEKPMATEPAECDAMTRACDEAGVQLVISHQRRSDPLHWYARKLLDDGMIGQLRYITGDGKPRRGGGELHNIGTHLIDAIGIFGGDAEWVSAYCSVDGRPCTVADREPGDRGAGWVIGDRVDLTIGYKSGVQASLQFNEDPGEFFWMLWGTEGRMALFSGSLWRCADPVATPTDDWELLELPAEPVRTDSGYVNPPDWLAIQQEYGSNPRVFMMREMFQRMESGGEHTSSGRVGAVPMEVIQATFVSHLNAERVSLPVAERHSVLAQ